MQIMRHQQHTAVVPVANASNQVVKLGLPGDVNDDGGVNVADAVFLLSSLFVPGSTAIPEPNLQTGCGPDPTDTDPLQCDQTACP